jgi:hypothetical protein
MLLLVISNGEGISADNVLWDTGIESFCPFQVTETSYNINVSQESPSLLPEITDW